MEVAMGCKEVCDYDRNRTVESRVYDIVTYFRNRGLKRDVPFEQAALALGISQRKVWSIFYGQAFTLLAAECDMIKQRFAAHLDEQADDLARRSEQARMKRRQIELDL